MQGSPPQIAQHTPALHDLAEDEEQVIGVRLQELWM